MRGTGDSNALSHGWIKLGAEYPCQMIMNRTVYLLSRVASAMKKLESDSENPDVVCLGNHAKTGVQRLLVLVKQGEGRVKGQMRTFTDWLTWARKISKRFFAHKG